MNQPTKPQTATSPKPTALWRNVSFTLMWTSTAASGFGDRMIMLAALALLGGLAADAQNSTAIQASTQFFFFSPYIVVSFLGGWLADRLPRKWLLLGCDESRGITLLIGVALIAGATGPAYIPNAHHWKVFLILAVIGCFAAIFNPTRNAIIPQIVSRGQLQSANAVILVINVVASMVGMVLGGWIISPDSAGSVRNGVLCGAVFYLVSGTFFAFLKPRLHRKAGAEGQTETAQGQSPPSPSQTRTLWQACEYAWNHKRVFTLVVLNGLVWAAAAAVSTGVLGVAKIHYGMGGDALLAMFTRVSAVLGAGMLIGAALIVAIQTRRESTMLTMSALTLAGLSVLVMAAVPLVWVTYAAALCVGVFGNVAIITILTLIQSISPNHVRGRVMGLAAVASTVASVSTYFVIWRLPNSDQNIIYGMFALGPILIVVGLIGLWRHMRHGGLNDWPADMFYRLTRLFAFTWHRLEMEGRQHVPRTGAVIVASNHTTGLDPILIQAACRRKIRWLMTENYRFKLLNSLWHAIEPIALAKDDSNMSQMRQIVRVLKDEQAIVGLFPEGGVQRTQRALQPLQPGLGMIARRSKATIVPVWIEGTPRRNNMLWHFLQPSHSRVRFGKPYKPEGSADDEAVLEELRGRLVALSNAGWAPPTSNP